MDEGGGHLQQRRSCSQDGRGKQSGLGEEHMQRMHTTVACLENNPVWSNPLTTP
jgi:hypothetical protein